jgi:CRP/FNR family transcriptional regulator, anaerobic regulatory protein
LQYSKYKSMSNLNIRLKHFGLSNEQIEIFKSIFTEEIVLEKGDFYIEAGEISKNLGFILSGMCRFYYDTENGNITRWVGLENDFLVSLSSFISQNPSVENIQAIKQTRILVTTKQKFDELYNNHEFIRQLWVKQIEYNYIGMENRVFNLIAMNAEERYNWMLKNQPQFNLQVPDKYIASMLGIKPRHLSRIRNNK